MDIKVMNELIADFMGITHTNHGWETKDGNIIGKELDFHNNWNHLMDVVRKCLQLFSVDVKYKKEIEDVLINWVMSDEEKRQAVWKACIHLIQHKDK